MYQNLFTTSYESLIIHNNKIWLLMNGESAISFVSGCF